MKIKFTLFILSFPSFLLAQQSVVSAGFNATGSGGTASYSVGQVAYQSKGPNIQILEGVQQPYEIIATLSTGETYTKVKNIVVYPNPVNDILFVDFNEESFKNTQYQLFDLQGRMIKQEVLNRKQNQVDFIAYPKSVYILKIMQENKEIKVFKIIKNK